ncbi:MAG: hypothetical protein HQ559_04475 [Lentisphaerae bacterium]|nr:hypothetical protein [Lentisphaerota bacterium]
MRALYRKEISVVETQYRQNLEKAPKRHIGNLKILENRFLDAGALSPYRAVEQERERFMQDSATESITLVDSPDALRDLQVMYLKGYHEMKMERSRAIVDLTQKYLRRLATLQKTLTRRREISEAEKVLEERERVSESGLFAEAKRTLAGDKPSLPDTSPIQKPRMPATGADALEERLGGSVVGWNPMTKELTVEYDFSKPEQLKDWQGGSFVKTFARMECAGEVATLRIPFLKVSRVIFEGSLRGDEESIRMTLGSHLTAEIGAGERRNEVVLYQDRKFPLSQAQMDIRKVVRYRSTMKINGQEVRWTVNDRVMRRALLRKPLGAPLRLGLGSPGNRTAYDSVLVQGTIDPEKLMDALETE